MALLRAGAGLVHYTKRTAILNANGDPGVSMG